MMTTIPSIAGHLPEHLIVAGLVAVGRWGAPRWGVGRTVEIANYLATRPPLPFWSPLSPLPCGWGGVQWRAEIGRVAVLRASGVIKGANCLHRAFALRIWLGSQGIPSRIVIGFRKREALEGHAWVEIPLENDEVLTLFRSETDGYREVADEELILARLRFL
ncbi:MAG: lasso peptide biosynthesis B2 protein [Bradymonadaceae bacterium]